MAHLAVDLGDEIHQPRVTDRPLRRRPTSPHVEPRDRDAKDTTPDLDGQVLRGHHIDGRGSPFGSVLSFNSSTTWRWTRARFRGPGCASSRPQAPSALQRLALARASVYAVLSSPEVDRLIVRCPQIFRPDSTSSGTRQRNSGE